MNNNKLQSFRIGTLVTLLFVFASIGLVVYLNYSFLRFWFVGEFNQNTASIEISYIQMAKFWIEGGGSWQSLWYLGYPWHVFYTPILPFFEVVLRLLGGFSLPHAYRVVTGLAYVGVPVSIFFFVWQISKSKTGALVSSLIYTVAPSLISLMFSEVGADSLTGLLEPRRFTILVRWGEGPHTLSLVFLPLFGLFLHRFIEKRSIVNMTAAAIFLAFGIMTNAIFLYAAALMIISFVLAEVTSSEVEVVSLCKSIGKLLLFSYSFVAFWYNLPFLTTFFREGGGAISNWEAMAPWGLILVFLVGFGVHFGVRRLTRGKAKGLAFAFFFFLMLFAIVYTYYASGESRLEYAPQALRLNTEVDLAFSVLVGVVISWVFLSLQKKMVSLKEAGTVLAGAVFLIPAFILTMYGLQLVQRMPKYTHALPEGEITKSAEYKTALKLKEISPSQDQRVFVPGNYSFWLNYFVDVPQLRGALFQSSVHPWPDHIYYQVTNGNDPDISLAWLKIANISTFVYTTAASAEPYKDYKVPVDKFDKVLTRKFEENGDIYYEVPLKNNSLAKVVDLADLSKFKKPFNAIDTQPIYNYLSWMERKSDRVLSVTHKSRSRLLIEGNIEKGEGILVQQTYDSGWRVKGGKGSIKRDALGFMVIEPKDVGNIKLELNYNKPLTVYLGYLITVLTLGLLGRSVISSRKKHPQQS